MVLDDALLPETTPQRLEAVLRPKMEGAALLDRLSRGSRTCSSTSNRTPVRPSPAMSCPTMPRAVRPSRSWCLTETATLSSKFQISIPKAIRAAQHWQAGLTFAFIPKGTGVLLVPVPKREVLKGLARGAAPTDYRDRSDRVR
jgi:AbrB family looped-hinge helix DNA binding protein